ncbi:MAG: glycosyltransferase [Candidatus Chisholmbacteria bacterium]|nr:glycosyltransferase [Candidatus Chisholmbacteria bacterium]
MKIAFVYDRLNKIGGAERVLTALHAIWPEAPWYTAVQNTKSAPFSQDWHIVPSFMQAIPFASSHHEWFPWLTPFAFESFSFGEFDVVISITSAEAKGIITKPQTLHICYCLTPTRYLWSHTSEYLEVGNPLLKPMRSAIMAKLRHWDTVAAHRPDHYLAISRIVQKRIKKYYHRQSQVLYPPIDTDFFTPLRRNKVTDYRLPITDYFLVVSRLVPYKKVDLAVKAATALKLPLVVVGVGSELPKLRRLAGPLVTFTGLVPDDTLRLYYLRCRALIFPGLEDFGLTILEAQSMGKPVIAYRAGGATESIKAGKTGLFFDTLSVSALTAALEKFATLTFDPIAIRNHVKPFATLLFKERFQATIEALWHEHQTFLK